MRFSFIKILSLVLVTLYLPGCRSTSQISKTEQSLFAINSSVPADSLTEVKIKPYRDPLVAEMKTVLNISEMPLVKALPEGSLGNVVSDAVLTIGNKIVAEKGAEAIDFCMLNNGGLRASLPKGEITVGNVFELMPFENEMVVLTLSGEKTKVLLEYLASTGGAPVAGIQMKIVDKEPVDVLIQGKPFDITQTYNVITSDYLAQGGDKMTFFNSPLKNINLGYKLRDAIIDYFVQEKQSGRSIKPMSVGRITNEK